MAGSGSKLFYRIGEVGRIAGVEDYVLRYWETEFRQLSPRKNRGGQRVYTRRELDLVLRIKRMLHEEGYTIAGARRKLTEEAGAGKVKAEEGTVPHVSAEPGPRNKDKKLADALGSLKDELKEILKIIKQD